MYGLILENLAEYIRQVYGEDRWEEIRRQASVDQPSFSVHQVYSENLIPRLAKKAIQVCLRCIICFTVSLIPKLIIHLERHCMLFIKAKYETHLNQEIFNFQFSMFIFRCLIIQLLNFHIMFDRYKISV